MNFAKPGFLNAALNVIQKLIEIQLRPGCGMPK